MGPPHKGRAWPAPDSLGLGLAAARGVPGAQAALGGISRGHRWQRVHGQTQPPPSLARAVGTDGHTDVSRAGVHCPPQKRCAQSGLGQPGHPQGSSSPHLPAARGWCGNSCARGPAPARWGLPAATRAKCQGWRDPRTVRDPPPTPPPPSPCTQGCAWCQCLGPHRGPVDEPVRLLLAVDDDAVALPPLLGRPVHGKGSACAPSPPLPPGSSGTSFCPAPALSPSRCCERPALTGAAPVPA